MINNIENAAPVWKSVMVTRHLPEELSGLETLCKNLWWCWNDNAKDLFRAVDYELWHKSGHNPMVILDKVSLKRYKELAKDKEFLAQLDEVMADFNSYMAAKAERTEPSVGYFCMEYGLEEKLSILNDPALWGDYGHLQESDHLYYMCTKFFSDGEVHKYFNPYDTPYEAFINYMNVLSDFIIRTDEAYELKTAENN